MSLSGSKRTRGGVTLNGMGHGGGGGTGTFLDIVVLRDASIGEDLTVGADATVTGDLTVGGTVVHSGNLKVDGTLEVDGETTLNDKLTVTAGGIEVSDDDITLLGTGTILGPNVTANTNMQAGVFMSAPSVTATVGLTTQGTLTAQGTSSFEDDVTLTGTAGLATTNGPISAQGVNGDLNAAGDVSATGDITTTIGRVTCANATVTNTLTCPNVDATAGDVTANALESTGPTTVGGNLTMSGGNLSVQTGDITVDNGNLVAENITSNGALDVVGNYASTSGNINLTNGDVDIENGDLRVDVGGITLGGNVTFTTDGEGLKLRTDTVTPGEFHGHLFAQSLNTQSSLTCPRWVNSDSGTLDTYDLPPYAQGTWSPAIGAGSTNFTMTAQQGRWIRIGNFMLLEGYITWSDRNGLTTSNVFLKNMPMDKLPAFTRQTGQFDYLSLNAAPGSTATKYSLQLNTNSNQATIITNDWTQQAGFTNTAANVLRAAGTAIFRFVIMADHNEFPTQ